MPEKDQRALEAILARVREKCEDSILWSTEVEKGESRLAQKILRILNVQDDTR